MCTGFELFSALLGIGSAAAPLLAKPAEPPPLPALAPPSARAAGATVRVGTGQDTETNTNTTGPAGEDFTAKRATGKAFTNLGRSGLAL